VRGSRTNYNGRYDFLITLCKEGRDPNARGSALYLKPDMASLSTGSVNFPTIVYENSPVLVRDLETLMHNFGVRPEIEIFDLSQIHGARRRGPRPG
jgi:3-keto-5-aminohexanoate cleavage enzyme